VVADVPAAAFEIAARADVPSIGLANFTWDWIYEPFLTEMPECAPLVDHLRAHYAQATLLLRLPFHGDMSAFPHIEDVPLIGRVRAAGKSTDQLQADIKAQLEREYYYHATVIMGLDNIALKASRGRVYVTGAVRAEGSVELPTDEPMTVSKAITKVGGFKDFANQSAVSIQRKGGPPKGIRVDVKAIKAGKVQDVPLQPEDMVVVPEKWVNF
jgi:hypothetical protein